MVSKQWLNVTVSRLVNRSATSPGTRCGLIPRTLLLVLCGVASGCDLPLPDQGLPLEGKVLERGLRGDVQSPQLACRGFIVFCPVWTVHWVSNRSITRLGRPVPPRETDAP